MRKTSGLIAVVSLGVALFVGGALVPRLRPEVLEPVAALDQEALLDPALAAADVDETIELLQRRIEGGGPNLAADQAALGLGYLQKARIQADPASLDDAAEALASSFTTQPRENFSATVGTAILAGSRHDFHGQLAWGRRAVAINPYNSQALGIVGDAHLELGSLNKGIAVYQKMIDLRPDLSSFGRISYSSQLTGNTSDAIAAMERALGFAGTSPENAAWAHWQLGELHIGAHDFRRADEHLEKALALVPGYGPALESTAHLTAARGNVPGARKILVSLVEDFPLPGNFAFLGELYLLEGKREQAQAAFEEADRRLAEYAAHEVRPDVDFVTFWADRKIHLERALRDARTLYSQRKSAAVSDSLAWALYANGRHEQARRYAREAIQRSVNDAGYHYHAGMIERALSNERAGRALLDDALTMDPSWSILESHRARKILARR
ncbi:MAG TPA: tetratricopeptide repeat protein [Actinomycetota bacterium]|nr:tetratricopeptide repeat protein [Actinomycetota bacterium]